MSIKNFLRNFLILTLIFLFNNNNIVSAKQTVENEVGIKRKELIKINKECNGVFDDILKNPEARLEAYGEKYFRIIEELDLEKLESQEKNSKVRLVNKENKKRTGFIEISKEQYEKEIEEYERNKSVSKRNNHIASDWKHFNWIKIRTIVNCLGTYGKDYNKYNIGCVAEWKKSPNYKVNDIIAVYPSGGHAVNAGNVRRFEQRCKIEKDDWKGPRKFIGNDYRRYDWLGNGGLSINFAVGGNENKNEYGFCPSIITDLGVFVGTDVALKKGYRYEILGEYAHLEKNVNISPSVSLGSSGVGINISGSYDNNYDKTGTVKTDDFGA